MYKNELYLYDRGNSHCNDSYPSFNFDAQIFLNEVEIIVIQVVVVICKEEKLQETTPRPTMILIICNMLMYLFSSNMVVTSLQMQWQSSNIQYLSFTRANKLKTVKI